MKPEITCLMLSSLDGRLGSDLKGIAGERTCFEAGEEGLADRLDLTLKSCEARGDVVWLRYDVAMR